MRYTVTGSSRYTVKDPVVQYGIHCIGSLQISANKVVHNAARYLN